jgi:hypothetical protein
LAWLGAFRLRSSSRIRYNALLRRIVSFARAAEHAAAR